MDEQAPLTLKEQIIAELGLDLTKKEDQVTLDKMLQASSMNSVAERPGEFIIRPSGMMDKTHYPTRSGPKKTPGY